MLGAIGTESFWGTIDLRHELAPGIVMVCTPSHGGIILDDDHAKRIEKYRAANFNGVIHSWEEDCDWTIPFLLFWDEIEAHNAGDEHHLSMLREDLGQAKQIIANYKPAFARDLIHNT